MDIYRHKILDHHKNPRNEGEIKDADLRACEENTMCGDTICLDIKLEGGKVKEAKFSGDGCALSVASGSMVTEKLEGMTVEELKNLTSDDILKIVGVEVTPARLKCALLPLETIKASLKEDA